MRRHVDVEHVLGRVIFCDAGFGLHRIAGDARGVEREFGDVRSARERFFGLGAVAVFIIEGEVVFDIVVEKRSAGLQRFLGVQYDRQVFVFNLDQFRRVHGDGKRGCDNESDRLSAIAHAVATKNVATRQAQRHAADAGIFDERGNGRAIAHVFAGEDAQHAGMRAGHSGVKRNDLRMRPVCAQEEARRFIGERPVRRVLALPRDEPIVLTPALELNAHCIFPM